MTQPPPPGASATGRLGQIREPMSVALLTLVTCGIYGLFWYYKRFDELKEHSGEGLGGVVSLLFLILCGIIPVFLLPVETGNLYTREGREAPVSWKTALWHLLPILGFFVYVFKVQGAL